MGENVVDVTFPRVNVPEGASEPSAKTYTVYPVIEDPPETGAFHDIFNVVVVFVGVFTVG